MYSISDAWDGRVDADLNGLIFTDMPWMIAPGVGRSATLRSEAEAAWGDLRGRGRLFALGHDAWLVQDGLRSGRFGAGRGELEGVTGQLALDDSRRVQRGLRWGEIRNSTLRLLDEP
jgi:outer membrane PBP1 activator LpoA protein